MWKGKKPLICCQILLGLNLRKHMIKFTYGQEKWMTPYETLFYPTLDCEDFTSLLYYLYSELSGIKNIKILGYESLVAIGSNNAHVNMAIPEKYVKDGKGGFLYKKKRYYVADAAYTGTNQYCGQLEIYDKLDKQIIE